jgi:transcriptional regulator with XRE-family HTH domain
MDKKKAEAIEYLARGLNQLECAKKLGITPQRLNYWVKSEQFQRELEAKRNEVQDVDSNLELLRDVSKLTPMDRLRAREINLLDKLEESMLDVALEGSSRAALVVIKISERRSKILGLDRRTPEVLDALNILLKENILPLTTAKIVNEGINKLWNDLKSAENN